MRRSIGRLSALSTMLAAVSDRRIRLEPDDLYKICMVVGDSKDTLGLKGNTPFLQALWQARSELAAGALPPFQQSMVDGALKDVPPPAPGQFASGGPSTSQQDNDGAAAAIVGFRPPSDVQAADGEEHTPIVFSDPSIEERIVAIWDCVALYQTGSYTMGDGKRVAEHCAALDPLMRRLSVGEVTNLVRALATLNFYDFNFSTLLARRCCELAPEMTARQLCQTYYNLMKLNVQDSLVAVVRRIDAKVQELKWKDIYLFCQALERQANTSAAPTALVPKLVTRAMTMTDHIPTPSFYRSMLVAMMRYNCARHPSLPQLVSSIARLASKLSDRDLVPTLNALVTMKQTKAEGFAAIFKHAEQTVTTIDIRAIDQLVDIVSVCPLDSSAFMANLMTRLTADAGRLTIGQLAFMIDLVSTYPPIRGTPCAVALAFTANVKKEALDSDKCEGVLLGLARMGHFTDDFHAIAEFLYTQRQGIRTFEALGELFQCLTPEVVKDPSMMELVAKSIEVLAPVINEEEMHQVKKALARLGVNDRRVQQRIFGAARQRSAQQAMRKKRYDPADDLL